MAVATLSAIKRAVVMLIVGYVFLGFGTVGGLYFTWDAHYKLQTEVETRCVNEQKNRQAIRTSLENSKRRLPMIEYYRERPLELKQQLAEVDRQLSLLFPPIKCEAENE